jgi:leucyl-tRNA synthetase
MILSYSYQDSHGVYHEPEAVEMTGTGAVLKGGSDPLTVQVEKMSKSKKNVVNPDEVVAKYGADALRCYEMFMGPFEATKPWDTNGIEGISRFLNRIWRAVSEHEPGSGNATATEALRHRTIKKVTEDIEAMRFNTALSALMSYLNEMHEKASRADLEILALLVSPFAPHLAEECWARLGHTDYLIKEAWPIHDPVKCVEATLEIPVQVNGKVRATIRMPRDADAGTALALAKGDPGVKKYLDGHTLIKEIFVPARIVTLVVK